MVSSSLLLAFWTIALAPTVICAAIPSLRIATYNVREDVTPDNITVHQSLDSLSDPLEPPSMYYGKAFELPWSTRRIKVYQNLVSQRVVLAGFQEALARQVNDLQTLFGDEWGWVGVGREDGVSRGEFNPIFYKKSDIKLISNDTFWLSNTPLEPSKYPDATANRICTVTHLTLTSGCDTPTNFTYLNTHLDDKSDEQRQLAASLLLVRARYEAYATGGPVFVTGDFNSPSMGSNASAYNIITGQAMPVAVNETFAAKYAVPHGTFPDFKMLDLKAQTPHESVTGNFATYTGFHLPLDASVYERLDFVFGGSNGNWSAVAYHVGSSLTDDGVLASDHRPVIVDVTLSH